MLASSSVVKLVREGLVRHRVAVQASAPPALPSIAINCRGLAGRIGLAKGGPASKAPAPVATNCADYELVLSLVNLRATLASRYDVTSQLSTACVTYDAGMRVDIESGFQRAQLTDLLRNAEVAHIVRDVHESAKVAWLHPGDGEALLASWQHIAQTPDVAPLDMEASAGPGRLSADEVR